MPFVSKPYVASLSIAQRESLYSLGYHPATHETLFVPTLDRYAGTYILGVQGSGKSGMLQNLIHADMEAGQAVIVIDPHGDLIHDLISHIPAIRMPHTYVLDMEDEDYPFGVNLFHTGRLTNSVDSTHAVERLMHIFEVLWPEVLSQQNLPRYVRAAAMVLLSNPGTTLVDMYQLLQDQSYRSRLVANVADPSVKQFWHTQYDNLGPHEQYRRVQPLIGRLEALFMGRSLVRNIVGQKQNSISFRKSIEQRQIILIKLPVKTLAQDARLVGTILLSQIHQAIFSFANVPERQRPGVSLYVDEFQHFATSDFSELLTEGRKFGVRVTIAHQYRNQLPNFLQDSTMTARTKVCFQLTPDDGREMAHFYPSSETTILPEDIEPHPVNYLLTHPSNDPNIRLFTDTYLHPMREHRRRGGRLEVDGYRYDYYHGHELPSRQVVDPTMRLNGLIYETMRDGNPDLPIPPEVVEGFSVCGRGFYRQAIGISQNDPLLQADAKFPRNLVVQAADGSIHWTRKPDSGTEQLFHFVFHLRLTMYALAEHPIGKATSASTTDVARMLTQLPRRAVFIRSGDTVGVVYTHNTPEQLSRAVLRERAVFIVEQTQQTYCRPKAEVERWFVPVDTQPVVQAQALKVEEIE